MTEFSKIFDRYFALFGGPPVLAAKRADKRYVLIWPKGSKMEFMGKDLQVVSAAAGSGATSRSVLTIGERAEFTGVLKEEKYNYRKGYHIGTADRDCGNAYVARVLSWNNVRK
ncbi:MAG: hypothetical protein HKN36_01130 [Hellea sp.]|nr:hypothetical protein [Hellea sp.]